jgi:hypothetical protein
VIAPVPPVPAIPPPDVAAVLPLMVLFWTRSVPAKPSTITPPPTVADVLWSIVLPRITSVPGVNPGGGAAVAAPAK